MWRSYTRHRGSAKKKVPSDANVGFRKATGGFIVERFTKGLARLAKVPPPELDWDITHGPWYDNNLATLETNGRRLAMRWEAGTTDGDDQESVLKVVADFR